MAHLGLIKFVGNNVDVADKIYLPIWRDVLQMNVSTIADVSKSKSAMTLSGQIVVSFFKLFFSHLTKSLVSLGGKNDRNICHYLNGLFISLGDSFQLPG